MFVALQWGGRRVNEMGRAWGGLQVNGWRGLRSGRRGRVLDAPLLGVCGAYATLRIDLGCECFGACWGEFETE